MSNLYRIGQRVVELLQPHCRAVSLTGALRRKDPKAERIEIIACPIQDTHPRKDMMGNTVDSYIRSRVVDEFILKTPNITWLKYRTGEVLDINSLGADTNFGANYIRWDAQIEWKLPALLTIYIARWDSFGAELFIRTGPDPFLIRFGRQLLKSGYMIKGFQLYEVTSAGRDGSPAYTPNEADVFTLAGVQSITPEARK